MRRNVEAALHMIFGSVIGYVSVKISSFQYIVGLLALVFAVSNFKHFKKIKNEDDKNILVSNAVTLLFAWIIVLILFANL